jgi:ubiquinone/menaquinone biosynthesis C-methylase UbiE
MTDTPYVHGYSGREEERLLDQANALTELLHHDTAYPVGSRVLEAGCGVGAQTITLARHSPGAHIMAVDISPEFLEAARRRVATAGLANVTFHQADLFALPFGPASFDHAFVCFVLEHLPDPVGMLRRLGEALKPGGTLTVIEGDHGSAYFHPDSAEARRAIQCLVDLQSRAGGNALVGRQLQPLLTAAAFRQVRVSPRMVYVDGNRPELAEGFTRNTFTAMVEGVRDQALSSRMIELGAWEQGIADLYRTAEPDGTFCYTFFKAVALR